MKTKFFVLVILAIVATFCLNGCAIYTGKDAGRKGEPWTKAMGQQEYFDWERNTLVKNEQEWILKENIKAYEKNAFLQEGTTEQKQGEYKYVLANLYRDQDNWWTAQVYKVVRPPYEDRGLWTIQYPDIIRLQESALLQQNERRVLSAPMGYYIVRWINKSGHVMRTDPLTLMPLHKVSVPLILLEGTGFKPEEIKNFSYVIRR